MVEEKSKNKLSSVGAAYGTSMKLLCFLKKNLVTGGDVLVKIKPRKK
jgi:hypothetical protein